MAAYLGNEKCQDENYLEEMGMVLTVLNDLFLRRKRLYCLQDKRRSFPTHYYIL